MAITASQAQGLVLALFGASAGGHLTGLTGAASLSTLAGDLSTSAGLVLDKDLSSNTAFRDLVLTTNLKLTGTALTEAQKWMDGEFTKGTARADILAAAVTFLDGLTDTTNAFYATAAAYRTTVANAVTWSQGAGATVFGVSTLMAQQGTVSSVPGQSFTLTTATDLLIGTTGNDTFTGAATTLDSTNDQIVDQSTTDNDVLNLSLTGSLASTKVSNVETLNVTISSTAAATVDAAGFTGAQNLTVTRSNVSVGDASIVGDKTVTVNNVNATKVAKITAGAGTTDVTVAQVTKAGATVDASTATGAIAVTGAATVSANAATGTVTATPINTAASTSFVENKKALSIDAAAAVGNVLVQASAGGYKYSGPITVNAASTTSVVINNATDALSAINATAGAVTVNAAKAATVTVDDATWGATVNAASANATAATVAVEKISSKGATVTVGTGTATKGMTVQLGGTSATTDTATVSAAGVVSLDVSHTTAAVDTVNVSGNGAAVTFTVTGSNGNMTTLAASGTNDVNVKADDAVLSGNTVTGVNTLSVTAHTASKGDLSKVTAKTISLEADIYAVGSAADTLTLANGALLSLAKDQTTSLTIATATAGDAITIATGDDNGDSTATPDLTTGTLDISGVAAGGTATAAGKVTIDATVGKLTLATATTATSNIDLVVKGTKDVALGTVTAKSLDASASTGKISLTATSGLKGITTGSGIDTVLVNDTGTVHTVATNAGNDIVNVAATEAASTVDAGDGNDTIRVYEAKAIVINAGAGDDTVKVGFNASDVGTTTATDAIIVGGAGSDTLAFDTTSAAALDLSSKVNFAISGFETIDLSAMDNTLSIKASVFAGNNTFALKGDSATDVLNVVASNTTGSTIDASGVTLTSGSSATLLITTGDKADTVTGSANNDTITTSKGADVIDGAAGTDTLTLAGMVGVTETGSTASVGAVINMGSSAVSSTAVYAALGKYISGGLTSVAAGTGAYTFDNATTNSANVKTISNIENITGSTGRDYIVGTDADNVITGGAGADYLKGGLGVDTFVYAAATGASATATLATALTLAAGDTIVGAEVIADIAAGDKIDLGNASAAEVASHGLLLAPDKYTIAQGTYDAVTGTFTVGTGGSTGADSILYWDTDSATTGVQAGFVVLLGVVTAEEGTATSGVITFA